MRLSIITINYNNCKGLKKTIDSVVSQTFRDFEWIVIDGGSTDGSRELIEQYADRFTYWVSEPDKGIYNAMNKGIKVAKGDYLQFLNSGDWLCDEKVLERCFSYQIEADVIYGDVMLYDGRNPIPRNYKEPLSLWYLYKDTICHNASFIRRELFQDMLYDETKKVVSDWEFFLKKALEDRTFYHIEDYIVFYDLNGISTINGELWRRERDGVIKELFIRVYLEDVRKIDNLESQLQKYEIQMDKQLREVCAYRNKRRSFRRLLNVYLRLVKLVDKI